MGNNAFIIFNILDTSDRTTVITVGQKQDVNKKSLHIMSQSKLEKENNNLGNL